MLLAELAEAGRDVIMGVLINGMIGDNDAFGVGKVYNTKIRFKNKKIKQLTNILEHQFFAVNNELNQLFLLKIIENLSRDFAKFGCHILVLFFANVDNFQVGELVVSRIIIKEDW